MKTRNYIIQLMATCARFFFHEKKLNINLEQLSIINEDTQGTM